MSQTPPVVLGASCAVWRDDRVLLILRGNIPQVWSLPGGRVEPGETVAQTAQRELSEETGLTGQDLAFVGLIEAIDLEGETPHHFAVAIHVARRFTGEPMAAGDARDVRWVTLDEVDLLETTGGLKQRLIDSRAVLDEISG